MKLNIGCGLCKLDGYLNVDIDPDVQPDVVFDFTGTWPYEKDSVEEIVCYHTIEHLEKWKHQKVFSEAHRVLVPDGLLVISFPEFLACAENWKSNKRGMRDFWEATIFGRQASPHDYHRALMNRDLVSRQLINHGFEIKYCGPEPIEDFNSVIKATKCEIVSYEEILNRSIGNHANTP